MTLNVRTLAPHIEVYLWPGGQPSYSFFTSLLGLWRKVVCVLAPVCPVCELFKVMRISADHWHFAAFVFARSSRIPGVGGVIPGQRKRSRATDVAQSFCLLAHPRIGFGINASPAILLFLPRSWPVYWKGDVAAAAAGAMGKVLPKFASVWLLFFILLHRQLLLLSIISMRNICEHVVWHICQLA